MEKGKKNATGLDYSVVVKVTHAINHMEPYDPKHACGKERIFTAAV